MLTKQTCIQQINYLLESSWSKKELRMGKVYELRWENISVAKSVIPLYVEKGWIIKKEAVLYGNDRSLLIYVLKPDRYR